MKFSDLNIEDRLLALSLTPDLEFGIKTPKHLKVDSIYNNDIFLISEDDFRSYAITVDLDCTIDNYIVRLSGIGESEFDVEYFHLFIDLDKCKNVGKSFCDSQIRKYQRVRDNIDKNWFEYTNENENEEHDI